MSAKTSLTMPQPQSPAKMFCFSAKVGTLLLGFSEVLSLLAVLFAAMFVVPCYVSWMRSRELVDKFPELFCLAAYKFYTVLFSVWICSAAAVSWADLFAVICLFVGLNKRRWFCLLPYRFILLTRMFFQLMLCVLLSSAYLWSARVKRLCADILVRTGRFIYWVSTDASHRHVPVIHFASIQSEETEEAVDNLVGYIAPLCVFLAVGCLVSGALNRWFYSIVNKCAQELQEKPEQDEEKKGFNYDRF